MEIDVGTRAILKLFLLPPGLLLVLLLLGWLLARRVFGRLLVLIATLMFYGLTIPAGVDWLASQLETVPALPTEEARRSRADAIVVFLAGTRRHNPEFSGADALDAMSLERIDHALRLHRATGLPIILSGGSYKSDGEPVARLAADWLRQQAGVTPIAVDSRSRDTFENALNTLEILERKGLGRVLLVTHAYHMPRARLSARQAGLHAIPAPFGFLHTPPEFRAEPELSDWLPQAGSLARNYLLLHEMAGLVWYGLTRG